MSDEIQRVLYVAPRVHIYPIPPLKSNQGYKASEWNVDNERARIFTARIRIVETATQGKEEDEEEIVRTDVRLEDPNTGELFANCPYEGPHCVEQVIDSSRFFAVRVVDGQRKAYLGIGFEQRSDAFDFGVSLQEVQKQNKRIAGKANGQKAPEASLFGEKKDYSLKEGQTISVTIGNKGRRRAAPKADDSSAGGAGFPMPFLPPPPSAEDIKRQNKSTAPSSNNHGFDDDFGDFV